MNKNRGFGLVLVLIIIGILVIGLIGNYLYLNQKIKINDSRYIKSEAMFSDDKLINEESYSSFIKNCPNEITSIELSSINTGSRCKLNMDGCQSSVPRTAVVCGNRYVITSFYLSGIRKTYGIFELQ